MLSESVFLFFETAFSMAALAFLLGAGVGTYAPALKSGSDSVSTDNCKIRNSSEKPERTGEERSSLRVTY